MEELRQALRVVHVALGVVGLMAFWVPIASRKGGRVHRMAGRVFEWSAYGVAGTAVAATAMMAAGAPAGAEGDGARGQAALLAYLALVTLTAVRHAVRVVRLKAPARVGSVPHRALAWATVVASVGLVGYVAVARPPNAAILLALSPVGLLTGGTALRYPARAARSSRGWWFAHMSAMLTAGIAFHTAFAVLGASRLFGYELEVPLALIPWLLPTVVGLAAIWWWTAYYRARFEQAVGRGRGVPEGA